MEPLEKIQRAITRKILTSKVKGAVESASDKAGKRASKEWERAASEAEREGTPQALNRLETDYVKILLDHARDQVKIATSAFWWGIEVSIGLTKLGMPEETAQEENKKTLETLDIFIEHQIQLLYKLRTENLPSREWFIRNLYLTVYNHANSLAKNPQENDHPPEIKEILIPAAQQATEIIRNHVQEKIASLITESRGT